MDLLNEFIAEIKRFGITKASELSGVSYKTIWDWVRRQTIPTLDKAQKVANALGLEFLLFDKIEE